MERVGGFLCDDDTVLYLDHGGGYINIYMRLHMHLLCRNPYCVETHTHIQISAM